MLARYLRAAKTYEDFVRAWYPDAGFGLKGTGPIIARNVADEREMLAIPHIDLPSQEAVGEALERLAAQEVGASRLDEGLTPISQAGGPVFGTNAPSQRPGAICALMSIGKRALPLPIPRRRSTVGIVGSG